MSNGDDGGQAFPQYAGKAIPGGGVYYDIRGGMSLRQYAAIKLCVPDSGLDWLDDMIRQAQRDRFAGQALAVAGMGTISAEWAYRLADAMLSARKGGAA
jgi:hypothetical protein